jgi:hypothetical protein
MNKHRRKIEREKPIIKPIVLVDDDLMEDEIEVLRDYLNNMSNNPGSILIVEKKSDLPNIMPYRINPELDFPD